MIKRGSHSSLCQRLSFVLTDKALRASCELSAKGGRNECFSASKVCRLANLNLVPSVPSDSMAPSIAFNGILQIHGLWHRLLMFMFNH